MKETGELLQRWGFFKRYNLFKSSDWRNLNNIDIKLHTTHGLLQQRLLKLEVTSLSSFRNYGSYRG